MDHTYCPYLDGCPLYEKHIAEDEFIAMADRFCEGDYENCARYKLRIANSPVPQRLWPDGTERTPVR